MSAPVVTRSLTRTFNGTDVVDDLSLEVQQGAVTGFIGPSGSGKTTTVRMMTGALPPSSGEVRVFGSDPRQLGTADRRRIGYMPQLEVLYPELTIADNLRFVAALYGVKRPSRRMDEVLEMLDMGGTRALRLEEASGGMQRRVGLASVLMHRPHLLFLDEPTAGLDPVLRRSVWDHLRDLAEEGRTIFVTTQIVSEAATCDAVSLIADGRLLATGTPEELRRLAAGGQVIDLHADGPVEEELVGRLAALPDVVGCTPREDGRSVRLVVQPHAADGVIEAAEGVLLGAGNGLRVAERHSEAFDDVFVQLLERTRG